MIRSTMKYITPIMLIVLVVAVACGGRASDDSFAESASSEGFPGLAAQAAPAAASAPAAPAAAPAPSFAAPSAPAPRPVAAPAAAAPPQATSRTSRGEFASVEDLDLSDVNTATLVSQRRIIVRTVNMAIVVNSVAVALDDISRITEELGGWVVSSDRSRTHRGSIAVRVPADDLDSVVMDIRLLATEIESEVATSQDVTDEYVDTDARLRNLRVTEEALFGLLNRADRVEDALAIQRELTRVQEEIERLAGRIKFLETTSAFSLVSVNLRLAPVDMVVDSGEDQTVSTGQSVRFRATFKPPEGIEEFEFTWDFGDGTEQVFSSRTAPTLEDDTRITATVAHVYRDIKDSPFIVEIEMTGFGDSGVTEGDDTLIITVTDIPTVEVFAGQNMTVSQGEDAEFEGSFTRPEGLSDVVFKWDFGDGTAPITASVEEGVTKASATHSYSDHRPFAYTAILTITAQSDAGEIESSATIGVLVTESKGWVLAGWEAGDTGRAAVRTLSGVGQGLATFLIWAGIFSPIWIVGGAVGVFGYRRMRNRAATSNEKDAN